MLVHWRDCIGYACQEIGRLFHIRQDKRTDLHERGKNKNLPAQLTEDGTIFDT